MLKINLLLLPLLAPLLMGLTTGQDPTRPPNVTSTTASSPTALTLSAVFIHPQTSLAIINGQAVKIGDRIGEYTVRTINPNTVELQSPRDGQETLNLTAIVKQEKRH